MEELDLLKKHWNNEDNFPKVDKAGLSKMLHKNSSSIVKWILIICLAEFLLGLSLKSYSFFYEKETTDIYDIVLESIGTLATGYFLYLFLNEYKKIKTFTDTRSLMNSIIRARDWVKKYIIVTLAIILLQWIVGIMNLSIYKAFKTGFNKGNEHLPEEHSSIEIAIILLITFSIVSLFLLLYYRLVYIRLIKKLQKNYEELIDLEG